MKDEITSGNSNQNDSLQKEPIKFTKSMNNNILIFYRCQYCYTIPFFVIFYDQKLQDVFVRARCRCQIKDYYMLEFLKIYQKPFIDNIKCKDCNRLASQLLYYFDFCYDCQDFICEECKQKHLHSNKYINFLELYLKCEYHKKQYIGYCKKCRTDICEDCLKQHSKHKHIEYKDIELTKEEIAEINQKFSNAQIKALYREEEIKENVLNILTDEFYKKDITSLFDIHSKLNLAILDLYKTFLNIYNSSKYKTYSIIINIKSNFHFDLNKFSEEKKGMNNISYLDKIYTYLKSNYVIKFDKENIRSYIPETKFLSIPIRSKSHLSIKKEIKDSIKPKPIENEKTDNTKISPRKLSSIREPRERKESISELYYICFDYLDELLQKINSIPPLDDKVEVKLHSLINYENFVYYGEFSKDQLLSHGRGIIIYKNGAQYFGYFQNGKKSKYGIYIFENSASYQGEWLENEMHGYGEYFYQSGSNNLFYEGYFDHNKKNGPGILSLKNGTVYEAIWNNNEINLCKISFYDKTIFFGETKNFLKEGYGEEIKLNTNEIFKGFYKNNSYIYGKYRFKNGSAYNGQFLNNMMNGYGRMLYDNGSYEGYFKNSKKHGIGRFIYKNGDVYEGYYFDDLRDGFGIMKYINGNIYTGTFRKERKSGIGILKNMIEDMTYSGEFDMNVMQGWATIFKNNIKYEGQIVNENFEGYGIYQDGECLYIGEFRNNIFHGFGKIIYYAKGEVFEGMFKNGKKSTSIFSSKGNEFATF